MSEEKTQTTEIKNKIKRKCKKKRTLKQKFYRSFKNSILNLSTFLISIILLVSIFSLLICVSTNYIKTTTISMSTKYISGIKIVQLSDINGRIIKNLNNKMNTINPDIVVITGDLVDSYKTAKIDEEKLLSQFDNIEAPIYFVPGDMEHAYSNYEQFKEKMSDKKIHILENTSEKIMVKNQEIIITGIVDPSFYYEDLETFNEKLKELKVDSTQILLSHRAELMNLYAENNYELVLSGHTHGGYVKIPFIGAIFSSNQGLFPTYVNGKYTKKNTTMIVSSGIGVGQFPFRLFNFGEIVDIQIN